jgi:large subunit ribosomal protein L18
MNYKKARTKKKLSTDIVRVIVNRSNKNVIGQVFDVINSKTLFYIDSLSLKGTKTEKSTIIGEKIAAWLKKSGIKKVAFDRNGYIYHGRVAALADGIRNNGIEI